MDKKEKISQKNPKEQNVLDWIIFSGATTEKEISKRFNIDRKYLQDLIKQFERKNLVKIKKSLLSTHIIFNNNSEEGKREKARLLPSISVVDLQKRFKTDIDVLKALVDKFGILSLSKTAIFFKANNDTVEEWAKILQSKGLLIIQYPILSEVVLLRKGEHTKMITLTRIKYIALFIVLLITLYYIQTTYMAV